MIMIDSLRVNRKLTQEHIYTLTDKKPIIETKSETRTVIWRSTTKIATKHVLLLADVSCLLLKYMPDKLVYMKQD